MHSFRAFSPRLIGPLLHGSGQADAGVQLCLYAERPEDVVFALIEHASPGTSASAVFATATASAAPTRCFASWPARPPSS